jgi:putative transposase
VKRRPRLANFDYTGRIRVFLTFCTCGREPQFTAADRVDVVGREILRTADLERVAFPAFCFMPDHVHLLAQGLTADASVRRFVHQAKQRSGYEFSRRFGQKLWQPSWYDHVLREDDETPVVVSYVLQNPVRAGLVERFEDYPFCGSLTYSTDEIRAWVDELEIWRQA